MSAAKVPSRLWYLALNNDGSRQYRVHDDSSSKIYFFSFLLQKTPSHPSYETPNMTKLQYKRHDLYGAEKYSFLRNFFMVSSIISLSPYFFLLIYFLSLPHTLAWLLLIIPSISSEIARKNHVMTTIINYIIKDDIILFCLLTQNTLTNWIDGIFYHMSYSKEKPSADLPYETMITRVLRNFNIDIMGKNQSHPVIELTIPFLETWKSA